VALAISATAVDTTAAHSLDSPSTTFAGLVCGKAVKIGHGPATVIGRAVETAQAESQDAFQARHTLALFARKSAAIRLALLARLFYFRET
jgi:hypothetical protein